MPLLIWKIFYNIVIRDIVKKLYHLFNIRIFFLGKTIRYNAKKSRYYIFQCAF